MYTPGVLYKCGEGFFNVSVPPSPKNHLYLNEENAGVVLRLVKVTKPLSQHLLRSRLKPAFASSTLTVSGARKVKGQPSGLMSTTFGIYFPELVYVLKTMESVLDGFTGVPSL